MIRPVRHWWTWEDEACIFLAKEEPVVQRRGDVLEVWTQYQKRGLTGTAGGFFVPELRLTPERCRENR